MVDAQDESEGWHVHLSGSAQEGGDLLEAAAIVEEQGASLIVSADSELK
jgi:hypothetical protein